MLAARNKHFFSNTIVFCPDLQYFWVLTIAISGVTCFEWSAVPKSMVVELVELRKSCERRNRNGEKCQQTFFAPRNTVIPQLVRSLRVRILGTRSFEDVQNDSGCAFWQHTQNFLDIFCVIWFVNSKLNEDVAYLEAEIIESVSQKQIMPHLLKKGVSQS